MLHLLFKVWPLHSHRKGTPGNEQKRILIRLSGVPRRISSVRAPERNLNMRSIGGSARVKNTSPESFKMHLGDRDTISFLVGNGTSWIPCLGSVRCVTAPSTSTSRLREITQVPSRVPSQLPRQRRIVLRSGGIKPLF